jgi:hypothetical protein
MDPAQDPSQHHHHHRHHRHSAPATQSMYQLPVTPPPERSLRRINTAPMGQLNAPYVAQEPTTVYMTPPPPPVVAAPQPYIYPSPQYYSPPPQYYPPMQQPIIIHQQHRTAPVYPEYQRGYEPTFDEYFGPDVPRRSQPSSAYDRQANTLNQYERSSNGNNVNMVSEMYSPPPPLVFCVYYCSS